jgi:hypothetical protein
MGTNATILGLPARFWAKTQVQDTGYETPCLLWTAYRTPKGYSRVSIGGSLGYGHRLAYEAAVGPIPAGLLIDHLCRVRHCVNPWHLEPVTNRENILRGETVPAANAAKDRCAQGHEFTPENTRVRIWRGRRGRDCLTCMREWRAARTEADRAKREPKQPRTHCGKGHPFDEANTYVNPKGWRVCRTCADATHKRYRDRKREQTRATDPAA